MKSHQEAVIFIPGLTAEEKDMYLNLLGTGLTEYLETIKVKEIGEAKIAGNSGKKFEVYLDKENKKNIDIYEVYWQDLFNKKLSTEELKERLVRGTNLLFYWFFGKTWLSITEAPFLFIGLGITLALFISWYFGILVMAFTAIGEKPDFFGFNINDIYPGLAENLGKIGKNVGGWNVWLTISALLTFIPINKAIDIADFTRRYLEENSEGTNLRAKIRQRVLAVLKDILETKEVEYEKITILAHSFGVVVGTDVLADYHEIKPIRYITLGSPLKVFSYQSKWIEKEIEKCLNNDKVESWTDCYSDQDWLCTKTPLPKGYSSSKIKFYKNQLKFSLLKQITGKSHDYYFSNEEVLKEILNL
jgi:hypothetical protein